MASISTMLVNFRDIWIFRFKVIEIVIEISESSKIVPEYISAVEINCFEPFVFPAIKENVNHF